MNEAPLLSSITERLRGIYRLGVNDGCGPLNGSMEFARQFDTPPIQHEAADLIDDLLKALEPFADIDGEGCEDFPDSTKITLTYGRTTHYALTLGDLRRARMAGRKGTADDRGVHIVLAAIKRGRELAVSQ